MRTLKHINKNLHTTILQKHRTTLIVLRFEYITANVLCLNERSTRRTLLLTAALNKCCR